MFENILNWKLKAGSHKFPGPDGGTCINEAAIVAAGFEYQRISRPDQLPPCFSQVLGAFAMLVNDMVVDDYDRTNLLMPYVTKLAGTADHLEVERARAVAILVAVMEAVPPRRSLPSYTFMSSSALISATGDDRAWDEFRHAMARVSEAGGCGDLVHALFSFNVFTTVALNGSYRGPKAIALALRRSFAIGKQAAPIDIEEVVERMAEMKATATAERERMPEYAG